MIQESTQEKTLHILVVDDNKDFCANCVDIFESNGYSVNAVYDGVAALDALINGDFDLVLMDIKMPVMDGVETYKAIKQIRPELPVIMMSAYAVEHLIKDALQEGAFAVFNKPLDFERLFATIKHTQESGAFIMVVDDDDDLCKNLSDILLEKGYKVKTTHSGVTAIQLSGEDYFDVIILDMKLPILNGLDTYLAIRDIRPSVIVILITGHRNELGYLVDKTLESSAYVCLEKPIDIDKLLDIIQESTL